MSKNYPTTTKNMYTLSKVIFILSMATTLALLALSLDPGKLQDLASVSIIVSMYVINFILLAIASIFYIWQRANRSTPVRDQLKTLELFADSAVNDSHRAIRRISASKEAIEKLLLTQSSITLPLPINQPSIEQSEILELCDPQAGYSVYAIVETIAEDTIRVALTPRPIRE